MVLADLGSKITGAIRKLSEAPVIDDEVPSFIVACVTSLYRKLSRCLIECVLLQTLNAMLKEIAMALMQADVGEFSRPSTSLACSRSLFHFKCTDHSLTVSLKLKTAASPLINLKDLVLTSLGTTPFASQRSRS